VPDQLGLLLSPRVGVPFVVEATSLPCATVFAEIQRLRCGCAYCKMDMCGGIIGLRAIGAGIVIQS